jgi:hypothetical protein
MWMILPFLTNRTSASPAYDSLAHLPTMRYATEVRTQLLELVAMSTMWKDEEGTMKTLIKPTQRRVKNALRKLATQHTGYEAFATYLKNGNVVVMSEKEVEGRQ